MSNFFSKKQLADLTPEDIGFFYEQLTVKIFMIVGFPVMLCFFTVHLFRRNYIESAMLFLTLATVLATYLSLRKNGRVFFKSSWLTVSYRIIGFLLAILFVYNVAVNQNFSGLHWCYLFPVFVAFALGAEEGFIWVTLFFFAIGFMVYASDFNFVSPENSVEHKIRFLLSFLMVSVVLLIISLFRHRNLKELFERQQALKRSEERYKKAFEQNKALLREIHHRVKNNLQVISGLLYLQSGKINNIDAKNLISETRNRVLSMAMVYESVYRSKDFTQIDMENYAKNLFSYLLNEFNKNTMTIRMTVDVKGICLGLDSAVPCCLILQELLSNAIKHAFDGVKEGEIRFFFKRYDTYNYKMKISDNGIGIPKEIDVKNPQTLGLKLISSLVAQMSGSFSVSKNKGTSFSINFPAFSKEKNP